MIQKNKEDLITNVMIEKIYSGKVKINDIANWDVSKVTNIRDMPGVIELIAEFRRQAGYEPINIEKGKEDAIRRPNLWARLRQAFQRIRR
jgi:surface protein